MQGLVAMIGASYATMLAALAVFVAARASVTALARVPGRLRPFREAPRALLAGRPIVMRVALTLAGPVAVYLLVTALSTAGLTGSDVYDESSARIDVMPSGPAAGAGIRDGDQIKAVGGEPIVHFGDLPPALARHGGEDVDLLIERDGRSLHVLVTPGPVGSRTEGKIGVMRRRAPASFSTALRMALARPIEIVVARARTAGPRLVELSGPIGIVHETNPPPRRSQALTLSNAAGLLGANALEGFLLLALFMFPFRSRRIEPTAEGASDPAPAASRPRPWVRCAARLVDIAVLGLVLGLALVAINPDLIEAVGPGFILLVIPIEAALLASWGFTPGKWLLRVSVRDASGHKLRFAAALRRAATAWTYGLGVNEATGLVTAPLALRRLRRRGSAYWDELDGHQVTHDSVGGARAVATVVIILLLFVFLVLVGLKTLGPLSNLP